MQFSIMKKVGLSALFSLGLLGSQAAMAQSASCEYQLDAEWGGGATATIEITNTGDSALEGWEVEWTYEDSEIVNSWNAQLSGSNPHTASDMGWNANIQPGQSASFGLQVTFSGNSAEVPEVTGSVCDESSDSSSSASSDPVADPLPSSSSESSASSAPSESSASSESSAPSESSASSESSQASSVSSAVSSSASSSFSSSASSSPDTSLPDPANMTSVELTEVMGIGWNLGNTLEAVGGETAWGNPEASQELIDAVKEAGFTNIRIPVAWSQFSDEANFVIDSAWMDRVEEVINYALNADMYIVMNMHWDGGWMQPTYDDQEYVNNRMSIMWEQIALRFQDYDYRLLFAGTNEVMVTGEYGTPTEENYTVQNGFNQVFVDTVRATGGLNEERHLVVQGYNTNIDHTVNFVEIPDDVVDDRLMMEVHYYDPYNFTLNESSDISQWGSIATDPNLTETWANEDYVDYQFQRMKENFIDQGYGVILGEYGVISRPNVPGHDTYRNYWNEYITQSAVNHGLVPMYWDNGYAGNGGFAIFDRFNGSQIEPELVDVLVSADD